MRIAVIGTGPAGLTTLYTIKKRLADKIDGLEVVAYERGFQVGGEWIYWDDADDIPLRSSMYRSLQTNIPKPMMQVHIDYPMPDDMPTYPSREQIRLYLKSFAENFQVTEYIRFGQVVSNIRPDPGRQGSYLLDSKGVRDTDEESRNQAFDYVFLCVGQHRKPLIPDFDSRNFEGEILHYHFLRHPERMYGKRVLVVGGSFGAMDMILALRNHVHQLFISWNKQPFWYKKDMNFLDVKPKIVKAAGDTVFFENGTAADVDAIIYATGFRQVHPLADEMSLNFDKYQCLFPIYKHVVHPKYPGVFFIGKAFSNIIQLARLGAEFGCAIIDKRVELPSTDEMLKDIKAQHAKWIPQLMRLDECDIFSEFPIFEIEREIGNYIAEKAGCEPEPPHLISLLYECIKTMNKDLMHYRMYSLAPEYDHPKMNDDTVVMLVPPK